MHLNLKILARHDGITTLALAFVTAYCVMLAVPEPFLRLSNQQKKEYLRNLNRRLRRKTEEFFNPSLDLNDCD
jgi:hypothetical protein